MENLPKPFYAGLDDDIKAILLAQIRNLWTHTSTAIEGNSLTLGDTAFVLEEGLTVAGKPLRDHQEVHGHAKGIDLIYRLVDSDRITQDDLFSLHRAVLSESITDIYRPVGGWKKESNYTNYVGSDGRQHWREFPKPANVPGLMEHWLAHFNNRHRQSMAPATAAAAYAGLHLEFVTVHPFFDGNGRMARLLANLPVLCAGFPPIVVPIEARQAYNKALSDYQSTVSNLAELDDIEGLPKNAERQHFSDICLDYWNPTLELIEEARQIQGRKHDAKPTTQDRKTDPDDNLREHESPLP